MLKKFSLLLFVSMSYLYGVSCQEPAVASDDLNKKFRYGCFCGENYPNIKHASKKSYRDLNQTERKELIDVYQKIDAYDDIDEVCKEHDICYITHGREAGVCNDTIYNKLSSIEKKFDRASDENISNEQCKNLAYDIASVFHTIFSPSDDEDTVFDFGMLMVNGAVTVGNKVLQESADTISDNAPRYPSKNSKCLLSSLDQTAKKSSTTKVKVITIKRD